MSPEDLKERLQRVVMVGDGAIGTQLYGLDLTFEHAFEELCLSRPRTVWDLHRDYVAAGAHVLQTNSFGANVLRLAEHGLEHRMKELNRASVRLARDASNTGEGVLVAGSVGPTGSIMAPVGRLKAEEAERVFRGQIAALAEEGVDLLILETFMELREMEAAMSAAHSEAPGTPIIATMSFTDEGKTIYGYKPEGIARALSDLGASVVGANCSVGPAPLMDVMERMVLRAPGLRYAVQPNAGQPHYHAGRYHYLTSPEYMARYARLFVEVGVSYVGGCCGTAPAHVAAMAEAVDGIAPIAPEPSSAPVEIVPQATIEAEATSLLTSGLEEKLAQGKFVISVEIDPPRGVDGTRLVQGAALCRQAGVDAINIADSPLARARMSALSLANLIAAEVDIEVILHMSCRDRNLLGLQSEVMGAYALGIRNILCVTGDPPAIGDYPHATGVFDVDAIGLVTLIDRLNKGVDLAAKKLNYRTNLHLGVAVNPTSPDLSKEYERFQEKIDAGARFAMTQPLYELEPMERFLELCQPQIPVLVGILPLRNTKHAEFMHNEVPDITIPEPIRARMKAAGQDGPAEGVAISRDLLERLSPYCQGVYLMPPFDRFEMAVDIVDGFIDKPSTGQSVGQI